MSWIEIFKAAYRARKLNDLENYIVLAENKDGDRIPVTSAISKALAEDKLKVYKELFRRGKALDYTFRIVTQDEYRSNRPPSQAEIEALLERFKPKDPK